MEVAKTCQVLKTWQVCRWIYAKVRLRREINLIGEDNFPYRCILT